MGTQLKRITSRIITTPVVSNGVAYTSGDCLGGLQTITNMIKHFGQMVKLAGLTVVDKDANPSAQMECYFFDTLPADLGDNNAFAPTDADADKLTGYAFIPTADNLGLIGQRVYTMSPTSVSATGLGSPVLASANNTKTLYFQLVTRGTPTYATTSSLRVTMFFEMFV